MAITPADQLIAPAAAFRRTLRACARAARGDRLVIVAVPARRPDPGLGYLRPAPGRRGQGVRAVGRFVEKPSAAEAARLLRTGRYFWNSGIFVWRARAILSEMRRLSPAVLAPLEAWAARGRRGAWRIPAGVLRKVPAVPIDKAVLERSRRTVMIPARWKWSDLGTWESVARSLRADGNGNTGVGRVFGFGATRCLAVNPEGVTVFVDVDGIVAVRSAGTLLICRRDTAARLRAVAGALRLDRPGGRLPADRSERVRRA